MNWKKHREALSSLGLGGTFIAAGTGVFLAARRVIFSDQPVDHPVALTVVGLLGILLGLPLFIWGLRMLIPGYSVEKKERDFIVVGCVVTLVFVTLVAILLTMIATFAWQPEDERRFSGGWTGSIWEHRIVWAVAAAVFDAAALLAWGLLAYGAFRSIFDRKPETPHRAS